MKRLLQVGLSMQLLSLSLACVAQKEATSNFVHYRSPEISNSLHLKSIGVLGYSNAVHVATKSVSKESPNSAQLTKQQSPETNQPAQSEPTPKMTSNEPSNTAQQTRQLLETNKQVVSKESSGSAPQTKQSPETNQPLSPPIQKTTSESELSSFPKFYALLIGVSEYKFSDQKMSNLANPAKDAEKLYHILLQKYSFANENTRLMKNATLSDIVDALEDLSKKVNEKDNLFIFYAGHGTYDENLGVGYWLPSDARPGKKISMLSNSSLKDYIAGIKSKHTLLVSDACFSGSIFRERAVDDLSDIGAAKLYKYPSRTAMTSGNMNTTPDESKFFEYFSKRLNENDLDQISAKEIFYNLFNAVVNNTNTTPLYGVIQGAGDEGGDFIFYKKK